MHKILVVKNKEFSVLYMKMYLENRSKQKDTTKTIIFPHSVESDNYCTENAMFLI